MNAPIVRLNGARIEAGTLGVGDAGLVQIDAQSLRLVNGAQILASTDVLGVVPTSGDGGDIVLNISQIVLDGSEISAASNSPGDGGRIGITGDRLVLRNGASISSASNDTGEGGEVDINVDDIRITGGSEITTQTENQGTGGDIDILGLQLIIEEGSSINTNTLGEGGAGGIQLQLRDLLELRGTDAEGNSSSIVAQSRRRSTGDGGDIFIDPVFVLLTDGATIGVDARGAGDGGNVFLAAGDLTLEDSSRISATTASGVGGNIELDIEGIILLRNGSRIATNARGSGDGGNIDIRALFIVAPLGENGDIIATANQGDGGAITLDAAGIFGFIFSRTPAAENNISAASRLGVNGTVTLNQPLVDPSNSFDTNTAQPVDPTRLVGLVCNVGDRAGEPGIGQFTTAGHGGLPNDPGAPLRGDSVLVADWVERPDSDDGTSPQLTEISSRDPEMDGAIVTAPQEIVEAQGWFVDGAGQVVLSARMEGAEAQIIASGANSCSDISTEPVNRHSSS